MKQIELSIFLLLFLFPTASFGAELNAGFVHGLWYSSEKVFADTPTRIYVAVRNSTPHDLSGVVYFNDNGKRLGSSDIRVLSGRVIETWIDWTPTFGSHKISAHVTNAELNVIGKNPEQVNLQSVLAEDTLTVDYDTDRDGVGNEEDTDDDNDGISDLDEIERGSNPLVPNPDPTEESSQTDDPEPNHETGASTTTPKPSPEVERGLERYTPEGAVDSLLHNVTDKVDRMKLSVDTYREKRDVEEREENINKNVIVVQSGTSTDMATITRSKIETEGNLLSKFVLFVGSIFHSSWTLILFALSVLLGHPALVQFVLLIVILMIVYRLARNIGRRPN